MSYRQWGFGGMQMVIAIAVVAFVSLIAVPKYSAFMTKSKITEALNLAGESKRKLSQFYMVNNRFPRNQAEAQVTVTTSLSPPKFVRKLVVEPGFQSHDVAVRVFLKDGVVENDTGEEQYIYITGDATRGADTKVRWGCGASGISPEFLPDNCKG